MLLKVNHQFYIILLLQHWTPPPMKINNFDTSIKLINFMKSDQF